MSRNENSKTEKITLNFNKKNSELFKILSDKDPKSENNKTDTIHQLLIFGFAFFLKQFAPDNIEDFKKNIRTLKVHNEITFIPMINKFYEKLKGGR